MQRFIVIVFGMVLALGAVTFTVAQDATPTPESASDCATPVGATPEAATPEPTVVADGTPAAIPSTCAPASTETTKVTIELVDIAFKPTETTVAAGVPVEITVSNNGLALHNFEVAALDISVNLGPGQAQTITVTAPAGDYDFICNIPGHAQAGMTGVLHVQ
jgi:uncharacterized cupredoxin-like copper-binding protein